jgi:hypothetical protein
VGPIIHYETQEFRGDHDIVLIRADGQRIRTDGVLYEPALAEDVLAILNWRLQHPGEELPQVLSC